MTDSPESTPLLELTLTGMAASGEAIGRHPETGKLVFVPDGLPGERVRVRITQEQKRWARGQLAAVLTASPHRVTPPCPYFGPPRPVTLPDGTLLNPQGEPRCAGCQWQHLDYPQQLEWKRRLVVDQLVRLGGLRPDAQGELPLVEEVIALGDPDSPEEGAVLTYGYRTQMRFQLDRQGRLCLPARPDGALPVDACLLMSPALDDLFQALSLDPETGAQLARELTRVELAVGTAPEAEEGFQGLILLEGRGEAGPELELEWPVSVLLRTPGGLEALVGDWGYRTDVGGCTLLVYPPQDASRRLLWPHLVGNEALAFIAGDLLAVQPYDELLDLWAGVGLFSLLLGPEVGLVLAVEEDDLAFAALEQNLAELENASAFRWPPEKALPHLAQEGYRATVAILTPPKGRLDPGLFPAMARMGVRRAAVVTDDLAGLARGLAGVQEQGFHLTKLQPVDLYPQTSRVTAIALFQRR